MAKGIEINGQLRGKRGGMVYYRSEGQQISRARNFAPKNPRTANQSVQRMVLSASAKVTSALKPIINHSWEGVATGTQSVRHFQSLAARTFRTAAASAIDGGGGQRTQLAVFPIKGAPIASAASNLPVSRGRLGLTPYTVAEGALSMSLQGTIPGTIDSVVEYEQMLSALGLAPGDQITFLTYLQSSAVVAEWNGYYNRADSFRFARLTFKKPENIDFETGMQFVVGGAINSSLIEPGAGVFPSVSLSGASITFTPRSTDTLAGAALIRSHMSEDGKYYYSSSDLLLDATQIEESNVDVYGSYMGDGTDIQLGDQLYLQHAIAAPLED